MSTETGITLKQLKEVLRDEFGSQNKEIEKKLNTLKQTQTQRTEQLTQQINGLKNTITQNTKSITQNTESIYQHTNRMDKLEQSFNHMEQGVALEIEAIHQRINQIEKGTTSAKEHMENITQQSILRHKISEITDLTKADITRAARKIIGIAPITNDDFKRHLAPNMTQDDVFACTIMEFLMLELKYTQEECEELDIRRITRPGSDNTDKLYLYFATEKSADFLQRRAIAINAKLNGTDRQRIHIKQFI